ncbi:MAG: hypothetical protein ACTHKR_09095 [Sphingomonas sp.]
MLKMLGSILLSAGVTGCGQETKQDAVTVADPSGAASENNSSITDGLDNANLSTPAVPTLPQHNYADRQGDTYYYVSAVSDEEQKQGRAIGDAFGYQFLGQNAQGEYILASVDQDGSIRFRARCKMDCRIIDTSYGSEIPYSPSSIIGAAFQDALAGNLQIAQSARAPVVEPEASPQIPVQPSQALGANSQSDEQPSADPSADPLNLSLGEDAAPENSAE